MSLRTLDYMIAGGIHDIVGGGFHGYTVDSKWLLPHFEKMLYDQALILEALTEASQITRDPIYRWTARRLVGFLENKMKGAEGGFYSALSSESGGVEGGFYTWSYQEIVEILDYEELRLALKLFNISEKGNYRDEASGRLTGRNILYIGLPLRDAAKLNNMSLEELLELLERTASKLEDARRRREPPEVDDKILVDWNGLTIAALSKAYRVYGLEGALNMARNAASLLERRVIDGDKVYHCYKDGEAYVDGMLADYSALAYGLMELYEATFNERYLELSIQLAKSIKKFWNGNVLAARIGGSLTEGLVDPYDASTPPSYSLALHVLTRASRYTGEPIFEEIARKAFENIAGLIELNPSAFTFTLSTVIDYWYGTSYEIVIASRDDDEEAKNMIEHAWRTFTPNKDINTHKRIK